MRAPGRIGRSGSSPTESAKARGSAQLIRLQKYLGPIHGERLTHDEAPVLITIDGAPIIQLRWSFHALGHNIELVIV
jgi:hypothetical protein